jgi:hypothetical protein
MAKVKVNWPDVETAFERNAPGLTSFIDSRSGEVLVVVDGAAEDTEKRRLIEQSPENYIKIESASSREQYRWMELFVATVEEPELRDRLLVSIDGKGAFRRFKDVLLSSPVERERWFNYRSQLLHVQINKWLVARSIEPDPPAPWGEVDPPPEPEEIVPRPTPAGQGPADVLRQQVKSLIDVLPAGELHSAQVFLEYLRDRGSAELSGIRGKLDVRRPFRRRTDYGNDDESSAEEPTTASGDDDRPDIGAKEHDTRGVF